MRNLSRLKVVSFLIALLCACNVSAEATTSYEDGRGLIAFDVPNTWVEHGGASGSFIELSSGLGWDSLNLVVEAKKIDKFDSLERVRKLGVAEVVAQKRKWLVNRQTKVNGYSAWESASSSDLNGGSRMSISHSVNYLSKNLRVEVSLRISAENAEKLYAQHKDIVESVVETISEIKE